MKFTIKEVLLSVFLIVNVHLSFGCSCAERDKFGFMDYLSYTTIVKGEVTSVEYVGGEYLMELLEADIDLDSLKAVEIENDDEGPYQVVHFKVEKVYKGRVSKQITFKSHIENGINCARRFQEGEKWYIFASVYKNDLFVYGCSWSDKVDYPLPLDQVLPFIQQYATIKNKVVSVRFRDKDYQKTIVATGLIIDGNAHGKWLFQDTKGRIFFKRNYDIGKAKGLWILYYNDEKGRPIDNICSKTFYTSNGSVNIEYRQDGKIEYGYHYREVEIPREHFTEEEITYLQTKARKY